ncbi:MAG: hypothetical protein M3Y58_17130 [Chloroflexota bacterium]|nr:hypothetical protein [Chloroflexota bacterium]
MAGHRGAVWLFGEVLRVVYDEEPLAQYQVKYARESGRIAVLTEERIYPPRFPSPQPYLWTLDWTGTYDPGSPALSMHRVISSPAYADASLCMSTRRSQRTALLPGPHPAGEIAALRMSARVSAGDRSSG